jgi:hypothetical protein
MLFFSQIELLYVGIVAFFYYRILLEVDIMKGGALWNSFLLGFNGNSAFFHCMADVGCQTLLSEIGFEKILTVRLKNI